MLVVGVGIDSAGWLLCYCVRAQNYVLYLLQVRGICWEIKMLQVVVSIC